MPMADFTDSGANLQAIPIVTKSEISERIARLGNFRGILRKPGVMRIYKPRRTWVFSKFSRRNEPNRVEMGKTAKFSTI